MAFDVTALSAYIEDQDFPLVAQMQMVGGLAERANIQTGIKGSSHLQFLFFKLMLVHVQQQTVQYLHKEQLQLEQFKSMKTFVLKT